MKCPPGVTSEVSVSAFGWKAKMERFTAIGDEDGRGGVIDLENKKKNNFEKISHLWRESDDVCSVS